MSWLSDLFGGGDSGPDPNTLRLLAINQEIERRRREAEAVAQEQERQRLADLDAQNQQAITTATSTNPLAPPPTVSSPDAGGPSSTDVYNSAFPSGFESTLLPSTFADPFLQQQQGVQRRGAQSLIDAMVSRGVLTPSGASKATNLLSGQDPAVQKRLGDISNVLLKNERAKLRGIGSQASTAASGTPTGFDVTPYSKQASEEASSFESSFPEALSKAVPAEGLYDTSGLASAGGAVAPSQISPQLDPYAQSGGQLKTGLEDTTTDTSTKKRTASIF